MRAEQVRYQLLKDGTQLLTMVLKGNCESECRKVEQMCDEGKEVNLSFSSGKRSLDENAFYWVLIGRIAKALTIPISQVHNQMLRRYGVPMIRDGEIWYAVIPDTEESEKTALLDEINHLKPTSRIIPGKGGTDFRVYMLMKPSHEMDVSEMAALIDGVQSELKEMGLPYRKPWEQ